MATLDQDDLDAIAALIEASVKLTRVDADMRGLTLALMPQITVTDLNSVIGVSNVNDILGINSSGLGGDTALAMLTAASLQVVYLENGGALAYTALNFSELEVGWTFTGLAIQPHKHATHVAILGVTTDGLDTHNAIYIYKGNAIVDGVYARGAWGLPTTSLADGILGNPLYITDVNQIIVPWLDAGALKFTRLNGTTGAFISTQVVDVGFTASAIRPVWDSDGINIFIIASNVTNSEQYMCKIRLSDGVLIDSVSLDTVIGLSTACATVQYFNGHMLVAIDTNSVALHVTFSAADITSYEISYPAADSGTAQGFARAGDNLIGMAWASNSLLNLYTSTLDGTPSGCIKINPDDSYIPGATSPVYNMGVEDSRTMGIHYCPVGQRVVVLGKQYIGNAPYLIAFTSANWMPQIYTTSRASQASVDAIPVNPLLTNDSRMPIAAPATRAEAASDRDEILNDVDVVGTAVSGIVTTLSGIVAAVWSYATRKLTSALTAESPAKDMAGTAVALPVLQGQVYTAVATQTREVVVARGDSPRITFDLGSDYSGWTCKFAAKNRVSDAGYAIEPKDATWTDATLGQGYVDLTALNTASIGKMYGELELRNGDQRLTAMKFVIRTVADIITT